MLRYVFSFILFFVSLFFSLALSPQEIYLNSDILYLPTLALDVLVDGGNFLSWSFTPSPYFFPDLPIVTVLLLIFENAQKALICFALLQTILFAVLMERFWIFVREEKKGSLFHTKKQGESDLGFCFLFRFYFWPQKIFRLFISYFYLPFMRARFW